MTIGSRPTGSRPIGAGAGTTPTPTPTTATPRLLKNKLLANVMLSKGSLK